MKKSQAEILAVLFIMVFVSMFIIFFLFFMNPDRKIRDEQAHLSILANAYYSSLFNRLHYTQCSDKFSFPRLVEESFLNSSLECDALTGNLASGYINNTIESSLETFFEKNGVSYLFNLSMPLVNGQKALVFSSWNCTSGMAYSLPTKQISLRSRITLNLRVCK
ncbi:MAG TPA: hypothetical protein ENN46_00275 [Candidatus Woesearchaeota archaeon]|nr:hypothetical protein [Candidatus Woesearchaeota archaeon]